MTTYFQMKQLDVIKHPCSNYNTGIAKVVFYHGVGEIVWPQPIRSLK